MRGPITTLAFVPNWATFHSTEYTAAWRPVFDLQRNPTNGATIQLTLRKKGDNILVTIFVLFYFICLEQMDHTNG